MQLSPRQQTIIEIINKNDNLSISEIKDRIGKDISIPTLNRDLAALVADNYILKRGKGRSTVYAVSPSYKIFSPIDVLDYFENEPDARHSQTGYNHHLFAILKETDLFTPKEKEALNALRKEYQTNIADYPKTLYQKELERLTIELSWKSSQIEGNTYSLLETERLFLEKEEAKGKSKEVHSLLIKDLGVGRNIRARTVGITGTAYMPLDNEFQIKEAIEDMCAMINAKEDGFEKALLAVALISYIQPFEDGNKRTARMTSNALLIESGICPLSYRSVDSIEYKKAMLLFYEQNNLAAFKQIFIEQVEFSVKNYFR